MSKFDYIFKEDNDIMLNMCNDLEEVLNKYGLFLITFVNGQDEYEGTIVAFFDTKEDSE